MSIDDKLVVSGEVHTNSVGLHCQHNTREPERIFVHCVHGFLDTVRKQRVKSGRGTARA